jgi:hypothetical protein
VAVVCFGDRGPQAAFVEVVDAAWDGTAVVPAKTCEPPVQVGRCEFASMPPGLEAF